VWTLIALLVLCSCGTLSGHSQHYRSPLSLTIDSTASCRATTHLIQAQPPSERLQDRRSAITQRRRPSPRSRSSCTPSVVINTRETTVFLVSGISPFSFLTLARLWILFDAAGSTINSTSGCEGENPAPHFLPARTPWFGTAVESKSKRCVCGLVCLCISCVVGSCSVVGCRGARWSAWV
jgi:hypothetical protein